MHAPENDRIPARDFPNGLDAGRAFERWRPALADAWSRRTAAPDHRSGIGT